MPPPELSFKQAIDNSGQLFVAAACNDGRDNDAPIPCYPASFDSPNILSVAAVDNNGDLAGFSNYGATSVDISAPGVNILSTFPDTLERPAAVLTSGSSGSKALTTGFGVQEIGASAGRDSFMQKALTAVGQGGQEVVLVDDDLSDAGYPDVRPALSAAIQSVTGIPPTVIDVPYGSDGPSLSQLQSKTVVWATGAAWHSEYDSSTSTVTKTTLTTTDQQTLNHLLSGGGKLVLTGRDALEGIEGGPFVGNNLRLHTTRDPGFNNTDFNGSPDTAFAGESHVLNGPTGHPNLRRVLTPKNASAVIQGYYPGTSGTWRYWNGTSMAAPHAAGAAALVASTKPSLLYDLERIKMLLMDNGKPVSATAGKTVTGKMVDVDAAIQAASDTISPTGTMIIDNNAASTTSNKVTLTISAQDNQSGSGMDSMRFQNDGYRGAWSAWEPYATTKQWKPSKGDGTKVVCSQFRDKAGNHSGVVDDHACDTIEKV